MKKRLLMQLLAAFCVVGAYAYNAGDYIYTNTAKYKATSENLVANGTFSEGAGGFDGWFDENGNELNSAAWAVTTNAGPHGENVLESLTGAPEGTNICVSNVWTGMTGFYTISYWIKGVAATTSTTTRGASNYLDFFVNSDGSVIKTGARQVADVVSYNTEWTQVIDTVEMHTGDYLVFLSSKLSTGTQITDFQINQVVEVYDTRVMERLVDYAEKLAAEPDLSNGKDDFEGLIGILKENLADPTQSESLETMEALMEQFNEALIEYLDMNSCDTYSGDWSTRKSENWNNLNNANFDGKWYTIGSRWGFSSNGVDRAHAWGDLQADGTPYPYVGYLERPENDGYVLSAGIQRGNNMNLGAVGVRVERTDLGPGKYFIAIEAQEVAASNNKAPYGENHNLVFEGPSLFVGGDTIVMRPATEVELENIAAGLDTKRYTETSDTLNGYYWKRYFMIGEVKEGETVQAGFIFPGYNDNRGGRASLRNPMFRMIGKPQLDFDFEVAVKEVIVQQVALKERLDNYRTDVAGYMWEKDSLERAYAVAQPLYDNSVTIVNPETGVSTLEITKENVALLGTLKNRDGLVGELLEQVNAMNRAKNWVISSNAIQDELKETVAYGQTSLDNPLTAGAPADLKAALQTAIAEGQALIDGISEVNQGEEFRAAIKKIIAAKEAYDVSVASRNYPGPIAIENASFEKNSGNITTATPFTNNGWNYTAAGTFKQWQFGTSDWFDGGHNCNQWRGSAVVPAGKAQQTVTLTQPGLYEYRAQAYACNDNIAQHLALATIIYDDEDVAIDTTYNAMPVRLFFGLDGRPDSIAVSKSIAPGANSSATPNNPWKIYGPYYPWYYSVFYLKTGTEPVVVEFGMEADAIDVGYGMNGFGFGSNKVYFVGPEDKYLADTDEALKAKIAEANLAIAQNESDDDYRFLTVKAKRYIADAEAAKTAKAKQNAYLSLKEMVQLMNGSPVGIKSIDTEDQKAVVRKGVFTLSGMKVADEAQSLKKGFYIINGKKYIIK